MAVQWVDTTTAGVNGLFLRVGIVGEPGVGKKTLVRSSCHRLFAPTVSTRRYAEQPEVGMPSFQLQVWAGGQNTSAVLSRGGLPNEHYAKLAVLLIVFDMTDRSTFAAVDDWLCEAHDKGSAHLPGTVMLVGNKSDCVAQREVLVAEARDVARRWGLPFVPASASTGAGVDELFRLAMCSIWHAVAAGVLAPNP